MILVDIEVPVMGRTYDFQLDETMTAGAVTSRIASIICIQEQCLLPADGKSITLWDRERRMRLLPEKTIAEQGIISGSRLLLV